MFFLALFSSTLDLKWNNTCVVKVLNVSFNVSIVSFQIQCTGAPSQKNKNSVTVQLHTECAVCVITVWNGSLESARPPSDTRRMMEAHVTQTLEVTPLLNCGKWMTGVCFAWRMGLCEAESSIQSHWLLWIGWLAIPTQAWFVSSLSFMSCCNQSKLFLFFLLSLSHFFTPLDGPWKCLR